VVEVVGKHVHLWSEVEMFQDLLEGRVVQGIIFRVCIPGQPVRPFVFLTGNVAGFGVYVPPVQFL
jgi:hypothetical protein